MKWKLRQEKEAGEEQVLELAEKLSVPHYLARALYNRGIVNFDKARAIFDSDGAPLAPPFLIKGMDKAVERILAAAAKKEKTVIYGDYDVDGVTAIVMLHEFLKKFLKYDEVDFYIPHRQDEGYGLNKEALAQLKTKGASLIISVDCGINSAEEAAFCAGSGMDIIITDHHVPDPERFPEKAICVLNPKLSPDFPDDDLSGAGVAYKLVCALAEKKNIDIKDEFLDFAALGTIADIVPLSDENRAIIRRGLRKIEKTNNPGLRALKEVSGMKQGVPVTTYHVGFILGPRINAAGRLEHARHAVELFISPDSKVIADTAAQLNAINDDRRKLMKKSEEEALKMLEGKFSPENDFCIVLYNEGWNAGIVGLVASRVVSKYQRPVFILTKSDDGLVHGSARSVPSVNIFEMLKQASAVLERFGGHKLAAGVTLKETDIDRFREMLNNAIKKEHKAGDFEPCLYYDDEIESGLSMKDVKLLLKLEPWGEGNPKPVFVMRKTEVRDVKILKNNTVKFYGAHRGRVNNFIMFGCAPETAETMKTGELYDVAFTPSINVWNGNESVNLEVKDIVVTG